MLVICYYQTMTKLTPKQIPRWLSIQVALNAVSRVLIKPAYFIIAVIGTFLSSGFILWSLNLDLISYVLFEAPVSLSIKLEVFLNTYQQIFTTFYSLQTVGIAFFSILFGINTSLLIFVLRHKTAGSVPKKSGGGSFALAVIGGGCIACGTSLVAPLFATIGVTSGAFLRDISLWFLLVASVLIVYSIRGLGLLSAAILAKS